MNSLLIVSLLVLLAIAKCGADHSTTILTPTYTDEGRAQRSVEFSSTAFAPNERRSVAHSGEHEGWHFRRRREAISEQMDSTPHPIHKRETSSEHPSPHKRQVPPQQPPQKRQDPSMQTPKAMEKRQEPTPHPMVKRETSSEHPSPHKRQVPPQQPPQKRQVPSRTRRQLVGSSSPPMY